MTVRSLRPSLGCELDRGQLDLLGDPDNLSASSTGVVTGDTRLNRWGGGCVLNLELRGDLDGGDGQARDSLSLTGITARL